MLHFVRATTTAAILRQRGCAIAAVFSILSAVNISAAAAATNFSGTSSGSFGLPEIDLDRDPNPTFSVERTAIGSTTFTLGQPGESSRPSQLTFTQTSFTAIEDDPFSVGEISFFNGQTFDGTNVSGVPLNVELILDSVSRSPYQFQYQFNFDLTLNDAANYDGDADIVAIVDRTQTQPFNFEQKTYELALLGFSQDEGSTFAQSLSAFEDRVVTSTLFAQIELAAINAANNPATDIPEPPLLAALLAFGSTLLIERRAM